MNNTQLEKTLYAVIKGSTLADIVNELSEICQGKADDIQPDDEVLLGRAKHWRKMANRLGEESRRAARYHI